MITFLTVKTNQEKLSKICEIVHYHFLQKISLLIAVPSKEAANFVDDLLWKEPNDSFIPHEISDKQTKALISITTEQQNLNDAKALLNLCPSVNPIVEQFEKVYEFFDETHPTKAELSRQKQASYALKR